MIFRSVLPERLSRQGCNRHDVDKPRHGNLERRGICRFFLTDDKTSGGVDISDKSVAGSTGSVQGAISSKSIPWGLVFFFR